MRNGLQSFLTPLLWSLKVQGQRRQFSALNGHSWNPYAHFARHRVRLPGAHKVTSVHTSAHFLSSMDVRGILPLPSPLFNSNQYTQAGYMISFSSDRKPLKLQKKFKFLNSAWFPGSEKINELKVSCWAECVEWIQPIPQVGRRAETKKSKSANDFSCQRHHT